MVTDKERQRLVQLAGLLDATTQRAAEHRVTYKLAARPGSIASGEEKDAPSQGLHDDSYVGAYSISRLMIVVAEGHLEAMRPVLPDKRFGISVLARAALEASARAWWHLEPNVGIRERTRRYLSERLYSLHQNLEVEDAAGAPQEARNAEARMGAIEKEAKDQGFEVATNKNGHPFRIGGEDRPGSGKLITAMMSSVHETMGPFMWKHTSAIAHGTLYALLPMLEETKDPFDSKQKGVTPAMQVGDVEWAVAVGALGHAEAFLRMCEVLGWDAAMWNKWRLLELWQPLIKERFGWQDKDE